ncbi:class I adenylate-forming enzyme family protein [Antrihabitans sp. YC2-6]|uniref:class I adenylate-forming enzyme family protein n=1 Tax=Antrihabitans sp. YC2-6 TaxID=2799498 RepID=UPI0018F41D06|nr:AMP-binding protein [Antrihabitans sp. YC2-6]MBJ8348288.1 AMP-binding protein [Antrihabitans sp. YC2-6]
MHLAELPDYRSRQNPDAPCVADDDVDMNNAQFADAVQRAADTLAAHGVGPGDVVAVKLPNNASLVVSLFAAWRLGAAVTPINPALVAAEVAYQGSDAAAKVLIADQHADFGVTVLSPADLIAEQLDAHTMAEPSDDALALLIYTSGTTGRPKGVMLDHTNLNAMCGMVIDAFHLNEDDHSLLILPLFHVNGIVVSTLSPLLVGGRATIAGRFSAKTFFDRLEQSRATYFSAVPTIYTMLADLPPALAPDTSAVRFAVCGAAPASVELLEKFESRYGIPLVEGYGLSEGTCASTINPLDGPRKPGTVGLPLSGQTIRIIDHDGNPVADGEAGEVVIAGPNVMRGYLNRPEDTASTVIDGWLHTGDIGRFDDDGYLMLVDRAKDMIIRGGENIYPKEIESVVYQLSEVAEAAVVGRSSATYGEEPVLFVALNSGAVLTADQIFQYVQLNMSKYKLPVQITVLDALPKNAVGKLDKPSLRRSLTAPASA